MRVKSLEGQEALGQQGFSDWLLSIGEGSLAIERDLGDDVIHLPNDLIMPTDRPSDLIAEIYRSDPMNFNNAHFLKDRAILTTTNKDVDRVNEEVMHGFPGEEHEFLSAESIPNEETAFIYPAKFLNTLLPSGLPPHKLTLKIGAPIMLLRNMNGSKGQANGTHLIVRGFGRHVIDAEIITRKNIGDRVFIPHIPLIASDSGLPFHLRRFQFPMQAAFGMTINKSQGQTLAKIGIFLPNPVFSLGQLYVALSRVGARSGIRIMISKDAYPDKDDLYTRNVVCREILR